MSGEEQVLFLLKAMHEDIRGTREDLRHMDSRVKQLEEDKVFQGGLLAGGRMAYALGAALVGALLTVGAFVVPRVMAGVSLQPSTFVTPGRSTP